MLPRRPSLLLLPLLLLPAAIACGGPDAAAPEANRGAPVPTASAAPSAPVRETAPAAVKNEDFLYLEDITSEKSLGFARAHNAVSEKALSAEPGFEALQARLFAIHS